MRAAASRTFWTAGSVRPTRMPMMAMTTNNSISVNARRERDMMTASQGRHFYIYAVTAAALAALAAGCGRPRSPVEGKGAAELGRMLRGGDPAAQAAGAYGLSRLGAEAAPAVPALAEALKSPDALVRQNAALALGAVGPEANPAVPALTTALADFEWAVRRQAALSLGQIGPGAKSALPALRKLSGDPNSQVRKAAKEATAKIQ